MMRRLSNFIIFSLAAHALLVGLVCWTTQDVRLSTRDINREASNFIELREAHRFETIATKKAGPKNNAGLPKHLTAEATESTETVELPGVNNLGSKSSSDSPARASDAYGPTDRERYLFELAAVLNARKVYPLASRRLGEAGRVVVRFEIAPDGLIHDAVVTVPSVYTRLNRAAVDLVESVTQVRPPPVAPGENPAASQFEMPIDYILQ